MANVECNKCKLTLIKTKFNKLKFGYEIFISFESNVKLNS